MSNGQDPDSSAGSEPASSIDVDLVVIPIFELGELDGASDLGGLDAASGGAIARARAAGEFRAKRLETFVTTLHGDNWAARRVALVGTAGSDEPLTTRLREAAAVGARLARSRHVTRMAFMCRGDVLTSELAQAVAEGVGFGGFLERRFKRNDDADPGPPNCTIVWAGDAPRGTTAAVERGNTIARATNAARELANAPANALTPTVFAERAVELASAAGLESEVLDEAAIRRLEMGLLLGVARGSQEPPRVLVIRYEPMGAPGRPLLGLVGKGVTFDSGGISIKAAAGMERMKSDMSGGAAVIGAMCAIGALGGPRRVIGVVPMTENMPSGTATKPGDVLTSAEGTTVEVINTDAEGRLILGDALWYARELGATHLVDVATLTGACLVALGRVASGLFGRPEGWVTTVQRAAARAGERVWPLPLYEEYRELLKSEMADLMNSAGRPAGACTAAAFLESFAGTVPWAHVDIAGTAWLETDREDATAGTTGVMVRTLVDLAIADGSW